MIDLDAVEKILDSCYRDAPELVCESLSGFADDYGQALIDQARSLQTELDQVKGERDKQLRSRVEELESAVLTAGNRVNNLRRYWRTIGDPQDRLAIIEADLLSVHLDGLTPKDGSDGKA